MKTIIIDKIKVSVHLSTDPASPVKAIADITLGPFKLKGFKIMESQFPDGENGDSRPVWVAPPGYRGKTGKFYDAVFCEDKGLWKEIAKEIVEQYNRRKESPEPEIPVIEEKENGGYGKHL